MKKARRLGALVIALAVFISSFAVAFADETQSAKYGQYISELAEKGKSSRALVSREIQELTDRGLLCNEKQTEHRRYQAHCRIQYRNSP